MRGYAVIGSSGKLRSVHGFPNKYQPEVLTDEQALEQAKQSLGYPSRLAGSKIVRIDIDLDNAIEVKAANTIPVYDPDDDDVDGEEGDE